MNVEFEKWRNLELGVNDNRYFHSSLGPVYCLCTPRMILTSCDAPICAASGHLAPFTVGTVAHKWHFRMLSIFPPGTSLLDSFSQLSLMRASP